MPKRKQETEGTRPRPRGGRARTPPSFEVPVEVQAATQEGWVRRADGMSERAGEPAPAQLEVAVFGVAVYRQPGGARAAARRGAWSRGLDWAVMPLQVTILLGLGVLGLAGRRRA